MNKKELFLLGVKHALPIILGYVPVGIAYAVFAHQVGMDGLETILMSIFGYSGAGQFLAVSMLSQHAGLLAITIGLTLINFRYFIMSACVFRRFTRLEMTRRLLLCHCVTDETFAIFTTAPEKYISVSYYVGLFVVSWLAWVSGAAIGVVANSFKPESVTMALGIALYALFIAIITPNCKKDVRIFILVAATAILNCVLYEFMASSWAIVTSTIVCAAFGACFIKAKTSDEKQETKEEGTEAKELKNEKDCVVDSKETR